MEYAESVALSKPRVGGLLPPNPGIVASIAGPTLKGLHRPAKMDRNRIRGARGPIEWNSFRVRDPWSITQCFAAKGRETLGFDGKVQPML